MQPGLTPSEIPAGLRLNWWLSAICSMWVMRLLAMGENTAGTRALCLMGTFVSGVPFLGPCSHVADVVNESQPQH